MRLLRARYFKFVIKSWNFIRTLLTSFSVEILREISLKITKTLTSALFWEYFFSLQTIYISLERNFYTDSTLQKNYTLKMSISGDIFTAQKRKFSITDFLSECDQVRSFLWIWSHLLKISVMENFIFCTVFVLICTGFCSLHDTSNLWQNHNDFPEYD